MVLDCKDACDRLVSCAGEFKFSVDYRGFSQRSFRCVGKRNNEDYGAVRQTLDFTPDGVYVALSS